MEQALNVFIENFVPIIASVVSGILLIFIRGVLKKYGKKLDVETSQRTEDLLASFIQQGVTLAEQWAHNRNKSLGEDQKTPGHAKLEVAMRYIANEVKKHKLDAIAEKEIGDKIESMLGIGTLNVNNMPDLPFDNEEDDDEENPLGL